MRRLTLCTSALLLLANVAWGQAVLQRDARDTPIDGIGGLKLGTMTSANIGPGINTLPALSTQAKILMLVCSVACHIGQGATPATATASSFLLPANTILQIKVSGTDSIAVIADTTTGILYAVEMN